MENSGEIKDKRHRADAHAFAEAMKRGETLQNALLAAGKTPAQARKGHRAVSGPLKLAYRELLGKDFDEMVEIGKSVTPEKLRHAVLGGIAKGIAERSDKGVQVYKLAGQWKDLDMWRPEAMTGVVVIETPALPSSVINAPMIDAPTPLRQLKDNNEVIDG